MRVVFCIPFLHRPQKPMLAALEAAVPLLDKFGIEHRMMHEQGNAYISAARAYMTRKALDWLRDPEDRIFYWDYDVSCRPEDLVKALVTPGEVVGGTYRFKKEEEEYMGAWHVNDAGIPLTREDGCLSASAMPAGFLGVTLTAIDRFMLKFPELCFGPPNRPSVDLFNHGAGPGRQWWGEDFSFCRRFTEAGGKCWLIPTLQLDHWEVPPPKPETLPDGRLVLIPQEPIAFKGNLANYLLRQPGGALDPNKPKPPPIPVRILRQAIAENWPEDLIEELKRLVNPQTETQAGIEAIEREMAGKITASLRAAVEKAAGPPAIIARGIRRPLAKRPTARRRKGKKRKA